MGSCDLPEPGIDQHIHLQRDRADKSFAYTLSPAGNRIRCAEKDNGIDTRVCGWAYDDLYRLVKEDISGAPGGAKGQVLYTYDNVGNRLTRTSTLPGVDNQDFTGDYDQNDRLTDGYGYDNNGSTTSAPQGWTYTYDAENHLLTAANSTVTISYTYDGDGDRVVKAVSDGSSNVITRYLTDGLNPTGYVQVVEELNGAYAVAKRYAYGLDLISQTDTIGTEGTQHYLYDGQGSTRILIDVSEFTMSTYEFDAFGIIIHQNGKTKNSYIFNGEQIDANLNKYYLRTRYVNIDMGRFCTMDFFEGAFDEPNSLHKFNFTYNNPINIIDPSGNEGITGPTGDRITELLQGYAISPDKVIELVIKTAKKNRIPIDVFGSLVYSESGFKTTEIGFNCSSDNKVLQSLDIGLIQYNVKYDGNPMLEDQQLFYGAIVDAMEPTMNLQLGADILQTKKRRREVSDLVN